VKLIAATKPLALRIQVEESGRARAGVPELRLVDTLQPSTHSAPGSRH
jgi:hypothetical protein